jgi:hypothetical protein
MKSVADAIAKQCLKENKESLTRGMFKYLGLPKDAPNLDKDTIWKKLVDEGLMVPVTLTWGKGKDALRPVIFAVTPFQDVMSTQCPPVLPTYPETYNIESLNVYLVARAHRQTNATIIQNYFKEYVATLQIQIKGTRGRTSHSDKATLAALQSDSAKHQSMQEIANSIGDKLFQLDERPVKRRKLLSKRSEELRV